MSIQRLARVVLCFFFSISPAMGQFFFRLDEESRIVVENGLSMNPIALFGIEFRSQQGLLDFGSVAPFIPFDPTSNYVPLADPNGAVAIDHTMVFDVTYDGDPACGDLEISLSPNVPFVGQVSASFRPVHTAIDVGMTGDQRLTIQRLGFHGREAHLSSLQFSSESGSLLPATTAAPFDELIENTANVIHYRSSDGAVAIDDLVTLDSGWEVVDGARDVQYEFTDAEEVTIGASLCPQAYSQSISGLQFAISNADDNAIKIVGNGQKLRRLTLLSDSGSLIAGEAVAPFAGFDSQSPTEVAFQIDPGNPVTIDGSTTTGIDYNPEVGGEDILFEYGLFGSRRIFMGRLEDYPLPAPLGVSIDWENPKLPVVLSGEGQVLRHFQISTVGDPGDGFLLDGLQVGNSPAPFEAFEDRTGSLVSLSSDDLVVIDGDVTTDVFFNAESGARTVFYEYQVGFGPVRTGTIQVPEPSCWFMTIVGLLGFTQLRRSRRY